MIDSRFVGKEVVVDCEGSLNGTMGHDFGLDFGNLGGNAVNGLSMKFVLSVGLSIFRDALFVAFGSGL